MANCPNCGSNHIQLKKETNVNWGRAVAGWALFGIVGGAVGAVTGEDRNVNACLDCGTSWKASDLYKMFQVIKDLAGITLDLTIEKDRLYLNRFVSEISPYIEAISEAEKQSEKILKESQNKSVECSSQGCAYGCVASIAGCSAVASSVTGGGLFLVLLLPPIVGLCIGMLCDKMNKQNVEQEIENTKRKVARIKIEAEDNFQLKVEELRNSY